MAGICYLNYHLPSNFVYVKDVIKRLKNFVLPQYYNSIDDYCIDFCNQSGLDKITIEDYENSIAIFSNLLDQFFKEKQIDPGKIGHIFYTDPKCFNLHGINIPQFLQKRFNMKNASVVIVDQGCAGTLWCMGASNCFLNNDEEKYSIILSASLVKNIENRYQGSMLIGDALGIMILKNSVCDFNIIDYISISDGTFSYNKYNNRNAEIPPLTIVKNGVVTIETLLKKKHLSIEDIYMMIPQSINQLAYTTIYPSMLKLRSEKVFIQNIHNGGHLGDVDTIRNLKDWMDLCSVPRCSYVLLYGQGFLNGDYIYNALLLQYMPL